MVGAWERRVWEQFGGVGPDNTEQRTERVREGEMRAVGIGEYNIIQYTLSAHPLMLPSHKVPGQRGVRSGAPQEHLLSAMCFIHLKALFHFILPTAPSSA